MKDPLADIFTTVGALFAMDQAFTDADFTEGVTAHSRPTINHIVHANGTIQFVDSLAESETPPDVGHVGVGGPEESFRIVLLVEFVLYAVDLLICIIQFDFYCLFCHIFPLHLAISST